MTLLLTSFNFLYLLSYSGIGASGTPVPAGTRRNFENLGTGQKKNFGYRWVPGTGQKKKFGYRWVPGTGKIFTYADPWITY